MTRRMDLDTRRWSAPMRAQMVAYRILHGLSRADVAERMGVRVRDVRRIEEGVVDAHLSTLRRYALAVGVVVEHTVRAERVGRHAEDGAR